MSINSNSDKIGCTIEEISDLNREISDLNREIPDLKRKSQINLALGYAGTILSMATISILTGSGIGAIPMIIGTTIMMAINGVSISVATRGHELADEANEKQAEVNEKQAEVNKMQVEVNNTFWNILRRLEENNNKRNIR